MIRRIRFAVGAVTAALLFMGPMVGTASGHPLGNFTVNHAAHLTTAPNFVGVEHVVDMAEVPTLQERARIDLDKDSEISPGERAAWAVRTCEEVATQSALIVDRSAVPLVVERADGRLLPGQAGLQTLRLECRLRAALPPATKGVWRVAYEMGAYAERLGWREVTAKGDRTTLLESDVESDSPSKGLTRYPERAERSPLDQRTARLEISAGGPAAGPESLSAVLPPGADGAARNLLGFLGGQQLGVAVALSALAVAAGLGATHALAPGHGKTLMAACMLGSGSRISQAVTLGVSVALSHTVAVLALAVLLSTTTLLLPERLYPLLAVASGVMVLSVGAGLARRAWRGFSDPAEAHGHSHHHGEHGHSSHTHGELESHGHRAPAALGRRTLITLGLAGGLVPAPSAIIVLLGASAFGQAWFGVLLVAAYGVGMAGTLLGAAWIAMRVRAVSNRRLSRWRGGVDRLLPLVTSAVVVMAGLALGARGIAGLA